MFHYTAFHCTESRCVTADVVVNMRMIMILGVVMITVVLCPRRGIAAMHFCRASPGQVTVRMSGAAPDSDSTSSSSSSSSSDVDLHCGSDDDDDHAGHIGMSTRHKSSRAAVVRGRGAGCSRTPGTSHSPSPPPPPRMYAPEVMSAVTRGLDLLAHLEANPQQRELAQQLQV